MIKKGIAREEIKTPRKRDKEGKKHKRKRKKRRGKGHPATCSRVISTPYEEGL